MPKSDKPALPPQPCIICGAPVTDYETEPGCCSGWNCTCGGLPAFPPVCGDRCTQAVFDFIPHPWDKRRELAGIPKYVETTNAPPTH